MMDGWSLKNRLINSRNLKDILIDAELNKVLFGSTNEIERNRIINKEFGYTKKDIDMLYHLLIGALNDLEPQYQVEYEDGIEGYLQGFDDARDWIKIEIDRLFGTTE